MPDTTPAEAMTRAAAASHLDEPTPAPEGRTQDVPGEAVHAVAETLYRHYDSEYGASHLTWMDFADEARELIQAAAPHLRKAVLAELLGTPEEIAAREAHPRTPDDTVRLCEMARPGEHERQVREQVAQELLAVDPAEWALAGQHAGHEAARVARGEAR